MIKNRKVQVRPQHYLQNYESLPMWINQWHQIQNVCKLNKQNVLEIGPGNGIVTYFLNKCGIKVITSDIDIHNAPTTLSDIVFLPFKSNSFDIILCCEVLEHIPFSEFEPALLEIYRVTNEYLIISLPAPLLGFAFALNLPRLPIFKFHFGMRYFRKKEFDGQHYWELGRKYYPKSLIEKSIKRTGFRIIDKFRPPLSLFCCFYILKKIS